MNMAMVIKNNQSATNTLNTVNKNNKAMGKSLKKLSSGMRINDAGDDASGYAISERMRTQIGSLGQDDKNTQNGNAMLQVASGAVDSTVDVLRTLKAKLINAANDTNTDADRQTLQREFDQMVDQIDDNANTTYNGMMLLDGSKNKMVLDPGTYTSLTNQSLSEDTAHNTPLIDLKDKTGNSLGILSTDSVTVSYVKQGETYVVTAPVSYEDDFGFTNFENLTTLFNKVRDQVGSTDLTVKAPVSNIIGTDATGNPVYTPDGKKAVTFIADKPGTEGQISGLTISITDKNGQFRRTANTVLDNFTETVRAENPSPDNSIVLHTGTKANQAVKVPLTDMRSVALGLKATDGKTLNISTQKMANAAINVVETALQKALDQQTQIGAVQMRLGMTRTNINTAEENTQASESVIRDADMAAEMTEYTKNNVLQQASQSMLAQANSNSSQVLSLLQ